MIAEFVFEGKKVSFQFTFNPNVIYWYRVKPRCYWCHKGGLGLISPGHLPCTLMRGSMKVDGQIIRWSLVPALDSESDSDPECGNFYKRAVEYFLSRLRRKTVHHHGRCLNGWLRDKKNHPGIKMRLEGYITFRHLTMRFRRLIPPTDKQLLKIYRKASVMIAKKTGDREPSFKNLRSLVCLLERNTRQR